MGQITSPAPAKLFMAIMISAGVEFEKIEGRLAELYGPMDFKSQVFAFDEYSRYYAPEMGIGLVKKFVSFVQPVAQDMLAEIKLRTNALELELGVGEGGILHRRVNLDPGYLTASKLVLATTKDFAHRIYLGQGIFAEITLNYRRGQGWQPHSLTYADYRSPLALEFFAEVRNCLFI